MLQLASSTSWWTANGEYGAGGVKEGEDEDDDDDEEVGAAGSVGNEGEERWHVADVVVAAGGGPKATSAGV